MSRTIESHHNGEFRFLNYSDVLKNIRDSFLSEMGEFEGELVYTTKGRTPKKWIRHCAIVEVLKLYIYVNIKCINVVLIPNDVSVRSHGLIDNDSDFASISIDCLDKCKRMIPLLIKKIDCSFSDIDEYLSSGEGEEFIFQLRSDRERLRSSICSFKEFKQFARNNGLKYILSDLINKSKFKLLFVS